MHVKCSTVIDNPEEKELFIKKVKCLGVKVVVLGNIIKAEYIGYNKGLIEVLLSTYEENSRSEIEIHKH